MADITKCKGTDCPLKETCYRLRPKESQRTLVVGECQRFLAMEELRQSYFTDVPFKDGKCEYYWNIK